MNRAARLLAPVLATLAVASCGPDPANDDDSNGLPQCGDGRDNDGDGKVDFPEDPGCFSTQQDDESDDCPSGDGCPQCANGIDDDFDGQIDFPDEDGCEAASSQAEHALNPAACGGNPTLQALPDGTITGTLSGGSYLLASCGGAGAEVAYEFLVEEPATYEFSTAVGVTNLDTVLSLRRACGDAATELACSATVGSEPGSTLTVDLTPGIYTIIIDAKSSGSNGQYQLRVRTYAPLGAACDGPAGCAPGQICRDPAGGDATVCTLAHCTDGDDNDGDGLIDFPEEPGCASALDDDEADTCPAGASCPACSNGQDDDGDGNTDYPDDADCRAASQASEGCDGESDPVLVITGAATSGSNVGATDDLEGSCYGTGGLDVALLVDLPAMQSFQADNGGTGFDSAIVLTGATCSGELECGYSFFSDSAIDVANLAAGTYAVVVDGYGTGDTGDFTVNIGGTIAPGGRCDGPLATAGVIDCPSNYTCGAGGTCIGSAPCNNGVDDDADGIIDYPLEPGCATPLDTDETDDCPAGPNCPACSNDLDDDGDGNTDYPADLSCAAAGAENETCASTEAVLPITQRVTAGTTVGAADDFESACALGGDVAGDVVYELTLPPTRTLSVVQAGGFDSVLEIRTASCGTPELDCGDFPELTFTNLPGGTYYVIVDGWSTDEGAYTLTVTGTLAAGDACSPTLEAGGVLSCPAGFACGGAVGSETCVPAACNDAVDADGDGLAGYPTDPGCTSTSDGTEADDCPNGPGCPACANGLDDDGDGKIDYGTDAGCTAASSASEFCGVETDATLVLSMPTTTFTTTGKTNNFASTSCQGNASGPDVALALNLPVDVATLSLDTNTSTFDTVLTLRPQSCGADTACDDDSGDGTQSLITRTNVAAGSYAIVVDGYSGGSGNVVLHASGTVAAGTACDSPLFTSNVLTCAAGTTCQAGTCQ